MGQSRWTDDDQIWRKRTPSFPSQESIVPRNAQKQRRWKMISTLLCWWRYDWNFFARIFLLISSVSSEQSQTCVMNTVLVKNGETRAGRTIWPIVRASKIIDNNTYTFDWSPCTWNFIEKVQRTSGEALTTRSSDKDLYWCRIPEKHLKSDSTSWEKTLTSCYKLQNQWHFVSTLCHQTQNQLTRHVLFEWTPKLGPCLKSQPVTCKVNMEWKLELKSVNKDNSHSWVRISHGLNEFVTDLIDREYDDNEQETSETKSEEFALKMNVLAFVASRPKG